MQKTLFRSLGEKYRIYAISDIHGNLDLLNALLEKIELSEGDVLVFDGDYINRGARSADTVRQIMRMSERENVYVIKGNLERLVDWYMVRGVAEDIIPHFSDHKNNLFCEWAKESGLGPVTYESYYQIRALLSEKYRAEIEYLKNLPLALETEDYIFVHAGLSQNGLLSDASEQAMVKNDGFLANGKNATGKWVVVGHTPVWNVPESKNTNNPVIFADRRVIGIDGGNCVKSFSQINALKIERDENGIRFENIFADESPVISAKADFAPQSSNGCFKDSWPDFKVRCLKRGEDFTLCENTVTMETGPVKNEHLAVQNGEYRIRKNTCSRILGVKSGERLYLLDEDGGRYAFMKNMSGEVGWVIKSALNI